MKNYYLGILLVIVSALGFSIMPIFAIYAYEAGVSVSTLLLTRFSLAALILFAYAFIKLKKIHVTRKDIMSLFILGGVCYTIQSLCYFMAVKYISVSLAVLILYTFPIFVSIISFLVEKERLTKRIFASIGISFLGLVLIMGTSTEINNYKGIIYSGLAALVYSFYIVYGNRVVKQIPPVVTSSFVALFTSFGILAIGLCTNSINYSFKMQAWLPMIGIALFSTVMSILTFFKGLELLGSTKASTLSMLEPIFASILSAVLLHEQITILQVAGTGIVLVGAWLIIASKDKNISPENDGSPTENFRH